MLMVPSPPLPSTRVCHIWDRVRALAVWGSKGLGAVGRTLDWTQRWRGPSGVTASPEASVSSSVSGGREGGTDAEGEVRTAVPTRKRQWEGQLSVAGEAPPSGPRTGHSLGRWQQGEGVPVGRRLQASLFRD